MRRPNSTTDSQRPGSPAFPRREEGIALLVVMIVFVVLYLVVFHLEYWTSVKAQIAKVRDSDAQSQSALHSMGLFSMTLLIEDLKEDMAEAQGSGGQGLPGMDGDSVAGGGIAGGGGPGGGAAGGQFVPLNALQNPDLMAANQAGGAADITHHDSKWENLFNDVLQSIGEVSLKVRVVDNESKFDLNRLFDYGQLVLRGQQGEDAATEGELLDAVDGLSEEDAARNLESRFGGARSGRSARAESADGTASSGRTGSTGRTGRASRAGDDEGEAPAVAGDIEAQLGLQEDVELTQFIEPSPEAVQATQEIVARAIETMISMNEDWGYTYELGYSSEEIAGQLIEYVLARRGSRIQNIIYHPSEILNLPSITAELYYGPKVMLLPGEEHQVSKIGQWGDEDYFIVTRDEFGDLVGTPLIDDPDYELRRQEEEDRLLELQEMYPMLTDFPGAASLGLGRMAGSSLTRGMEEPEIRYDEEGIQGYLLEPPLPIGLEDIFCTFSTGKININTAPVPILYGLLLSLESGVGEANSVAVKIGDYRDRLQELADEEEGAERISDVPDLGQPRRTLPEEEDDELGGMLDQGLDLMDPAYLESAGSAYQDLETNYFTNLSQIELVDGYDDGPDDELKASDGVDKISGDQDSLYRRVLNDYQNIMVFGSTYFTIEIKGKMPNSPLVKTGYLVVKRDTKKRMLEVILWKELQ